MGVGKTFGEAFGEEPEMALSRSCPVKAKSF
jgi:hypothetical protein